MGEVTAYLGEETRVLLGTTISMLIFRELRLIR
jgi:hypothetical protein